MAGKKYLTNFASHLREMPITGVLVQLVRMPACHAGGHGFESRTHRKQRLFLREASAAFFVCRLLLLARQEHPAYLNVP